ncbi:MAG: YhbY family RNA-binding protein [Betaproteobacteria bacterium]
MLSPSERKALKARAHKLNPLVIVGAKGLTPEVLREIDLALKSHELIKVRAPGVERDDIEAMLAELAVMLEAEPVQRIGKILVLYRKRPEESLEEAPESSSPRRRGPRS